MHPSEVLGQGANVCCRGAAALQVRYHGALEQSGWRRGLSKGEQSKQRVIEDWLTKVPCQQALAPTASQLSGQVWCALRHPVDSSVCKLMYCNVSVNYPVLDRAILCQTLCPGSVDRSHLVLERAEKEYTSVSVLQG